MEEMLDDCSIDIMEQFLVDNNEIDHGTSPSGFHYLIAIIPDKMVKNKIDVIWQGMSYKLML